MLGCLRGWLRRYFTRVVWIESSVSSPRDGPLIKRRRAHRVSVSPSERFVWAMVVLIVALAGLIAIEIVYVLVTGQISTEILVVIGGLVGALASRFLEAKRQ